MKVTLVPMKFAAPMSGAPNSPMHAVTHYKILSDDPTKFLQAGQQHNVEPFVDTFDAALAYVKAHMMNPAIGDDPRLGTVQSEINVVTGEITLLLGKQDLLIDGQGNVRLGHRDECLPQVDWDRFVSQIR